MNNKDFIRKIRTRFPVGRKPHWGDGYYTPAFYNWLFKTNNPKRSSIHDELEFNQQQRRLDDHKQWGYGFIKRKLRRDFFKKRAN